MAKIKIDKSLYAQIKTYAEETGVSMSLHLPYTYVGAATMAFQESDRKIAVELQKKYIDFATKLGCGSIVMHPGSVPFYQALGEYLKMLRESLIKTLKELEVSAEEALMIGDFKYDVIAGRRAGCFTCFITNNRDEYDCDKADFVITTLSELPGLLNGV